MCLQGLGLSPAATTQFSQFNEREIQAALQKLPEGGELVLPEGTFEIHTPIVIRRNGQSLRGCGAKTILHLADYANCPVIVMGSPLTMKPVNHLRLSNITIDGNRKNQQLEYWESAADGSQLNNNGIDIWNANDATVEHVTCRSCRSGGLVAASARRLAVNDFSSSDNQFDGIACYVTEDSKFTGLKLFNNVAAGISLDLSFNHNVIKDAVMTGNDLGVFMRQSRSNSFQCLTISKSRHQGVFMAQTEAVTAKGVMPVPGTECSGNVFQDLVIADCGGDAFTVHDATCKNNSILGAHFRNNKEASLGPGMLGLVNKENFSIQ